MANLEKAELKLGFIPLTDCAPLVIAVEKGCFAKYGLEVSLSREVSWATIRDKVFAGVLDGAQMLAAMPIATTLGLGEVKKPTVAVMSLDLNGNAITLSRELYQRIAEIDPEGAAKRPLTAAGLRQVIERDQHARRRPMSFATVFPYSTHNYLLRYWLAAADIDPDQDLRLCVIPPPYMADCLLAGDINGYCVGEPWNSLAVTTGTGLSPVIDADIWSNKPEKVLGMNEDWVGAHPATVTAMIKALLEASQWLDESQHRAEAAAILARPEYVDAPVEVVRRSLTNEFRDGSTEATRPCPDFHVFYRYAATYPWRSHAVWFITQMYRWGQIAEPLRIRNVAEAVYLPDYYRVAAHELGLPVPDADHKTEGEHVAPYVVEQASGALILGADYFCDGRIFNPEDPVGYLRSFPISRTRVSLDELHKVNV